MSPVRHFTMPKPMDGQLESIETTQKPTAPPESDERSMKNAKTETEKYTEKQHGPLAASKNSNGTSKPGITFAAQGRLPKLPIPDLEATCKRYLESLDPMQTQREHNDSERAVQEFLRSDGPELQDKLKAYSTGKSSYIEQFCMSVKEEENRPVQKCFD